MPLYPHSILKKPSEFPPVPFNLDEEIEELEDIIAAGECGDDGGGVGGGGRDQVDDHISESHSGLKYEKMCNLRNP